MILIHIMLNGLAILDLFVKQGFKNTFIRSLGNTGQHLIPIGDECFQVFPSQLHAEQTLESVSSPMFDIGTEVVLEHAQHLTCPRNPSSSGFGLLESVYFTSEVTCDNIGEGRE